MVSSSLAVSKALSSRSSSKPLAMSSSPLASPSGYCPLRPEQRSGKRSASSSRSGGLMCFTGGKGSAPSSTPSGFRKWEPSPCLTLSSGCLSLHWHTWRERGADPRVVDVLREGYRFPFLRPPPLSTDPIPMPSYAPTSINGAAFREVTLALIAKGAVEVAPLPSPGFSSRLFVVWKTSGPWRPVIDLSLLICFVDISLFHVETIPSVLMSVRQGIGWPPSIFGRRISRFLCIRNLGALWLMAALTISKRCASVCPRPRWSSLGFWLLYPLFFIPWVSVCVGTWTTGSSRHRHGRLSSGISGLSCPFVASWGSWSTRRSPTSLRLRWYSILGLSSTQGVLWFFHRQIASPGCGQPPSTFCPPQLLLPASGSCFWRCCPLCLIWFQGAACGCDCSSFAFTALGIGWILRLRCRGLRTVLGTFGGGSAGITSLAVCLSFRCPQIWTSGPTLAGGLTGKIGLSPAFGTSRRLFFQSLPGCCWLCVTVSSTSSPFCQGPRWPCFAAMSPRSPISVRRGAHGLLLSTPLCRRSSVGRIRLAPQFIPGIRNVLADSLSRPHQSPISEWSLNMAVFRSLLRQWSVVIAPFATSNNHRCSIYFSPYRDPLSAGTDTVLQSWAGLLAYAFPPWSILHQVLA